MKYTYAYKTSDGQRHEAAIEAESREAVFATLRQRGIKAIKVVAADGSKANGEVRGVRKRAVAALVALVAIGVGVVAYRGGTRSVASVGGNGGLIEAALPTAPRHQIYGDPVIVEEIEHGKTEAWLANRVDQLLAWFAQPGKLMVPKGKDPRRLAAAFAAEYARLSSSAALLPVDSSEPREVRELKQIVNGMRSELVAYLANGNGTPRTYWRRLIERTQQELQIYERTRRELETETNPTIWEEKNESLRRLGLRTIPNPKDTE